MLSIPLLAVHVLQKIFFYFNFFHVLIASIVLAWTWFVNAKYVNTNLLLGYDWYKQQLRLNFVLYRITGMKIRLWVEWMIFRTQLVP